MYLIAYNDSGRPELIDARGNNARALRKAVLDRPEGASVTVNIRHKRRNFTVPFGPDTPPLPVSVINNTAREAKGT